VRMRPINTKPASVGGGIATATSAFRISFSRTTSDSTFVGLSGNGRSSDFDADHIPDFATSLIDRSEGTQLPRAEDAAAAASSVRVRGVPGTIGALC
jgi:hypothetical protein